MSHLNLNRSDRNIQAILMVGVAIVSVMTLGIGYRQQTSGMLLQGGLMMPKEDQVMPSEGMMKVDEAAAKTQDQAAVPEVTTWCCNGGVKLCYEQPVANGCGKDALPGDEKGVGYSDFETCAGICK